MRTVLRTLCGCERVLFENAIMAAPPDSIYVPLPVGASLQDKELSDSPKIIVRQFKLYSSDRDTVVYLEVAKGA